MSRRSWQSGIIIGAFLVTVMILSVPRSADASGFRFRGSSIHVRHGFVHPHRSFHGRHRFFDFDHRFVRNRLQIDCIQRRFDHTPRGRAFRDFGYVPQELPLGKTVIIFRR